MPFYTFNGDGEVAEKFSTRKKAQDEYDINQSVHFITDGKGKVLVGDVPDGVDPVAALAEASGKPAGKEKAEKSGGGQRGGRNCPICKGPMFPGLPAEDAQNQKGMAYRKCPEDDYTRWHPIAHVAMLLSEVGWPTYRDTLGGGQRAARRVIELTVGGLAGPEAYQQTIEESKDWEDWAPGREAQRALTAAKKEREKAAKDAEKAKAAELRAAEKAKAQEAKQAEKEAKAAERKAAKEAAAKAKAEASSEEVDLP